MLRNDALTKHLMSFWNRRRVALTLLAAATGAIVVVWIRAGNEGGETTNAPTKMPPVAMVTAAKDEGAASREPQRPPDAAQLEVTRASALPVAPSDAPPVAVAPAPPPPVVPPSPAEADQPIYAVLTAPTEANNGSVVEIALMVAPVRLVQFAVFHVSYDPAVLEPLELVDSTGTASPPVPSASAELEVGAESQQGVWQWPVIRFQAHTQAPQSTQITVTAEAWDDAGNAMTVGLPASHTMVVWP